MNRMLKLVDMIIKCTSFSDVNSYDNNNFEVDLLMEG